MKCLTCLLYTGLKQVTIDANVVIEVSSGDCIRICIVAHAISSFPRIFAIIIQV